MGCGHKGMEKMDKELKGIKMGAYSSTENPPNAPEFICPSPKVLDFNEKRLHCESVVRGSTLLLCYASPRGYGPADQPTGRTAYFPGENWFKAAGWRLCSPTQYSGVSSVVIK